MKSLDPTVLINILKSYAFFNPEVEYCQGMNYIAGNLIFHAEEAVAFWLLDFLFKKLGVRDLYIPSTNYKNLTFF